MELSFRTGFQAFLGNFSFLPVTKLWFWDLFCYPENYSDNFYKNFIFNAFFLKMPSHPQSLEEFRQLPSRIDCKQKGLMICQKNFSNQTPNKNFFLLLFWSLILIMNFKFFKHFLEELKHFSLKDLYIHFLMLPCKTC